MYRKFALGAALTNSCNFSWQRLAFATCILLIPELHKLNSQTSEKPFIQLLRQSLSCRQSSIHVEETYEIYKLVLKGKRLLDEALLTQRTLATVCMNLYVVRFRKHPSIVNHQQGQAQSCSMHVAVTATVMNDESMCPFASCE